MTYTIAISSEDYPGFILHFLYLIGESGYRISFFQIWLWRSTKYKMIKKIWISIFKYGKLYAADKAVDFEANINPLLYTVKSELLKTKQKKWML